MDYHQGIQKAMLLLWIGVSLFFHHGIGVEGGRVLSMEEDLELEKELKLLNKPSIKSIQIESGDIFDCVDIYKQPAFDHPLLKDHKIQMQPSSYPSHKLDKSSTEDATPIELPKISCPPKTVPIRRITKEDLIRMNARSKHETNHTRKTYPSKSANPRWAATLNTVKGRYYGEYYGTKAFINVWGLPNVLPGQWASSQIFVRSGFSGSDNKLMNALEAGWRVEPNLFGDTETRLFIYWTGDGYVHTGCHNLLCPGFVQTNNTIALGHPISPLSTYGGEQIELPLTIYKDPLNHQWWLVYNDHEVGYWPSELFNSLTSHADEVFWGGNAVSTPDLDSPPMGSGHFANQGFGKSAYVRKIMVVNSKNHLYPPASDEVFVDDTDITCYNYFDGAYTNPLKNLGDMFYYGGRGGCRV